MRDPRLPSARAELDDTRGLLVDLVEHHLGEVSHQRALNHIDSARLFINAALVHLQQADETYEGDHRE